MNCNIHNFVFNVRVWVIRALFLCLGFRVRVKHRVRVRVRVRDRVKVRS